MLPTLASRVRSFTVAWQRRDMPLSLVAVVWLESSKELIQISNCRDEIICAETVVTSRTQTRLLLRHFVLIVGYSDMRSFPGIPEGQLRYWVDVQEFGYNPLRMTSNEYSDPSSFHLKVKTFIRPVLWSMTKNPQNYIQIPISLSCTLSFVMRWTSALLNMSMSSLSLWIIY